MLQGAIKIALRKKLTIKNHPIQHKLNRCFLFFIFIQEIACSLYTTDFLYNRSKYFIRHF